VAFTRKFTFAFSGWPVGSVAVALTLALILALVLVLVLTPLASSGGGAHTGYRKTNDRHHYRQKRPYRTHSSSCLWRVQMGNAVSYQTTFTIRQVNAISQNVIILFSVYCLFVCVPNSDQRQPPN